jgi:hypothetical protein
MAFVMCVVRGLNKFVEMVTIRARVAYVLGIAEHIISDIKSDSSGYLLAKEAIKTAWAWQNNASVSADVLNEYLMNEDEEGLLIHEQEASEDMVSAWVTITTAIAYVAWHAYQQKDEFPPGALCEDRYDVVEQVIEYASKTNVYDADFVNKLSEYLISSFRTKNANELGKPINREEFLKYPTRISKRRMGRASLHPSYVH